MRYNTIPLLVVANFFPNIEDGTWSGVNGNDIMCLFASG